MQVPGGDFVQREQCRAGQGGTRGRGVVTAVWAGTAQGETSLFSNVSTVVVDAFQQDFLRHHPILRIKHQLHTVQGHCASGRVGPVVVGPVVVGPVVVHHSDIRPVGGDRHRDRRFLQGRIRFRAHHGPVRVDVVLPAQMAHLQQITIHHGLRVQHHVQRIPHVVRLHQRPPSLPHVMPSLRVASAHDPTHPNARTARHQHGATNVLRFVLHARGRDKFGKDPGGIQP